MAPLPLLLDLLGLDLGLCLGRRRHADLPRPLRGHLRAVLGGQNKTSIKAKSRKQTSQNIDGKAQKLKEINEGSTYRTA